MKRKRGVLHVTNWYPSLRNPNEALWIKRQIDALADYKNEVWHVRTIGDSKWSYNRMHKNNWVQWIISLPTSKWILIEFFTFLQLLLLGIVNWKRIRSVDVINFHIAYPLLTFWKFLRPLYGKPIVITEHWSAYHFNFGVEKSLPRIQRIFRQRIPVITVSQSLANDIRKFSGAEFQSYVVPNVVDKSIFFRKDSIRHEKYFFMVSQWKEPKDPFVAMEAFLKVNAEGDFTYELIIGGYGQQWQEMEQWVREHDTNSKINLIGSMDPPGIADRMRRCTAFLHSSGYETFSVVCAEALCCGAPVVASNVGGIPEFVGEANGILVKENVVDDWVKALNCLINERESFDRELLAQRAAARFSVENVGALYNRAIHEVIESYVN